MSSSDTSGITESIANLSITTTAFSQDEEEHPEEQATPRQTSFPSDLRQGDVVTQGESQGLRESSSSGSNTEREDHGKMPSGSSSKHHSSSSSSKKHHSSSSSSKHHSKSDDWSDVTEPEERRRIQNRIAQRKFRELHVLVPIAALPQLPSSNSSRAPVTT